LPFGQATILDFGTRRDDATTRAPPDDGVTPSISHSIQHPLLSVL
jgi:hypothetical protein